MSNSIVIHNRRYMRLRGWDYSSPGCYFVTICVKNKECFLADIVDGKVVSNKYGKIIESRWQWLKSQYNYVELDAFVVMPNHVHGLVRIIGNPVVTGRDLSPCEFHQKRVRTESGIIRDLARNELQQKADDHSAVTGRDLSLPTLPTIPIIIPTIRKLKSLSDIIGAFKTTSSKDIHLAGFFNFFWQRSFFERIIRSENEVCKIHQYIRDNPVNWDHDEENPGKKWIRSDRS